jgi:septum formation protein
MPQAIILASASPRRKELLEKIGFVVREMPANIPEERMEDEAPENYVKRLARDKVLAVVERIRANLYPGDGQPPGQSGQLFQNELRWVVGADTVVVVDEHVLEKPVDQADAIRMVSMLAGREHQVITGFCIFDIKKNKEGIQAVTSGVKFKNAAPKEVESYVSTGESLDKAGGYAVQGIGGYLVEYINGSYTNVVGLPLCQVVEMMQELGAEDVLPF